MAPKSTYYWHYCSRFPLNTATIPFESNFKQELNLEFYIIHSEHGYKEITNRWYADEHASLILEPNLIKCSSSCCFTVKTLRVTWVIPTIQVLQNKQDSTFSIYSKVWIIVLVFFLKKKQKQKNPGSQTHLRCLTQYLEAEGSTGWVLFLCKDGLIKGDLLSETNCALECFFGTGREYCEAVLDYLGNQQFILWFYLVLFPLYAHILKHR